MQENKKSLAAWFEEKYGKRPSALATPDPSPAEEVPAPAPAAAESAPESEPAVTTTEGEAEPASAPELASEEKSDENEPAEATLSLYEQLGGEPAVEAAVEIFYRKVLSDDRIGHFFEDTDMNKQIAKQKAFLTMAFGGPHHYTGKDMRAAHANLANRSWKNYGLTLRMQTHRHQGEDQVKMERGLKDSHFDAVLENLRDSLAELGVTEPLIAQVNAIAESTRDDVLGR